MSKIHLDLDDIETREFKVLEDLVFFDEYDLETYLDSCEAELLTDNFFPDARSLLFHAGLEGEDINALQDEYGDEFEEVQARYDEEVDMLKEQFKIRYNISIKQGVAAYKLIGKYGNLQKFCSEYCGDLAWTERGKALEKEFEDAALVNIESGDQKLILFSMSEIDN